jgi:hypothetical protein
MCQRAEFSREEHRNVATAADQAGPASEGHKREPGISRTTPDYPALCYELSLFRAKRGDVAWPLVRWHRAAERRPLLHEPAPFLK